MNLGKIPGPQVKGYWFNPRTGTSQEIEVIDNTGTREFTPPSEGFGADWVLVLDDVSRKFPPPGRTS